MTERRVISLWLPHLATDRLTRRGAWRQRPLATVGAGQGGLRLGAVNAAAAAAGIAPGMTAADARALFPGLKTVAAAPGLDGEVLAGLAAWCGRYSPWTAVDGLAGGGGGGLWLDATGCAHLFGGEAALLAEMVARLDRLGFTACAAIADTPGAAWAAARFAAGAERCAVVPEGAARQLLAGLAVAALRLPAEMVATLHRLGLRRIGDLFPLPRAGLAARFGPLLATRLDQFTGAVAEPISPRRPPTPYHARLACAEPIGRIEDVVTALERLLAALARSLERDRRGVRRLELTLFRVDGSLARVAIGTARPTRDPGHLARLLRERLDGLDAGFGIEALTLVATEIGRLDPAQMALARRHAEPAELALLVDRLGNRLGAGGVYRLACRPSHLPEQAVAAAPPLGPLPSADWPAGARPPRLLPRPEPLAAAAAGAGPPPRFHWRDRPFEVVRAEGPERIAAPWWHGATPPPASALRDYWRVEGGDGRRLWLFRDGTAGGWFVHGLFA